MESPQNIIRNQPFSTSSPTVGIIGGGQLARMLCISAAQLGVRTLTLERQEHCPAAAVSTGHQVGDWNDTATLMQFAQQCDVVTLENNFVDAGTLETLEQRAFNILPHSGCLKTIQDKVVQKTALQKLNLPTPRFQAIDSFAELEIVAQEIGYPCLLKQRHNGYDGKGIADISRPAELETAWHQLSGDTKPLYCEAYCDFLKELAVIICRSASGAVVRYPVVETIQKDHICSIVKAPADIPTQVRDEAIRIAARSVAALGAVGCVAVEMFLTRDHQVLVNELALRVHNSGHYTIEACFTSQFENHIRAVLNWPLGNPDLVKPAAVMFNLLGDAVGTSFPSGVEQALKIDGVRLHLYAKDASKVGRKMGHLTVLGDTMPSALNRAKQAAQALTFKNP
ncbi:MAG: N5-carboxyaminoimidazole ribonucleotide synthase [Verrucomicrobia subdivision 3 bacterium]|nr:N5-carboxyaminoimidazole ribonucleotide synthase [Limisphaerales bacterium]MCS1416250.1 N5-carboxyaminoimidazole ribonucleotide synthase [Limisphaerales bacterium]